LGLSFNSTRNVPTTSKNKEGKGGFNVVNQTLAILILIVLAGCAPSTELVQCIDAVNVVNDNLQIVVDNQQGHDDNMYDLADRGMEYCKNYCDTRLNNEQ
jgi:hypothetical protein